MHNTRRLATLVLALLIAPAGHSDSLLEVYHLAAQNDPQLREAEANRLAVREAKPQALGALLPQINGSVNLTNDEQDINSVGTRNSVSPLPFVINARSDKLDWRVELRQTVFRWDQWLRLKQADKQLVQADLDYRAAELNLFTRVADAYFNVLAAEDTLTSTTGAREAIGRQLEQAEKRFEVGLIAITDVQEAQAGFDQAVATEILARRALANRNEVLREIIGEHPPRELAKPREEIPLVSPAPVDEDQWVTTALQQNFGLQSAQLAAEIARDDVRIARSGHLPSVDLVASHTDNRQNGEQDIYQPVLVPNGVNDLDLETDVIGLQIAIPVFSGGVTNSRVRQTVHQHRAAKERVERAARQTERETRDAYLAVTSEISRVKALQQALKSSQTALQATEAGFEVGTRTMVDVLDARRQLLLAETNYARSRYDYIVNVLKLKEAAGVLAEPDIAEIDGWLQPAAKAAN